MQKKIRKIFFVSEIISSENVAINCRKSPKILHITKRDIFKLNCVHKDE